MREENDIGRQQEEGGGVDSGLCDNGQLGLGLGRVGAGVGAAFTVTARPAWILWGTLCRGHRLD